MTTMRKSLGSLWAKGLDLIRRPRTLLSRIRSVPDNVRSIVNRLRHRQVSIDTETILSPRNISELLSGNQTGSCILVPTMLVRKKLHPLSIPSAYESEQTFYEEGTFWAPELKIERIHNQHWFPESGFLVTNSGKVWGHSVLGQYGDPNFQTTSAVEAVFKSQDTQEYVFHRHRLKSSVLIKGPVLITSHYASHNFGHFLLDMVPLISIGAEFEIPMVSRPLLPWQTEVYRALGVNEADLRTYSEKSVFLESVLVSNRHNAASTYAASPAHRDVFAKILRNLANADSSTPRSRKLFLSRGSARSRRLRNRSELEELLAKRGFAVVEPATLSFDQQALLFSQAEVIVSEFGAVMANVVFCKPGTTIIEIIPENQNDPWSRHLCASLDLTHVVLFHTVRDEDRESYAIADRIHKNIFFEFDANIKLIDEAVRNLD